MASVLLAGSILGVVSKGHQRPLSESSLITLSANTTEPDGYFIHIARSAGESIAEDLQDRGLLAGFVHMSPAQREDVAGRKVVVNVRDPVDRIVSAFNWRHPSNSAQIHTAAGSGEEYVEKEEEELYACFDRPSEWANALNSTDWCGYVAMRALETYTINTTSYGGRCSLESPALPYGPSIIHGGLDFHLGDIVGLLSTLPFMLVRYDHLDEDMAGVRAWLGDDQPAKGGMPEAHTSYPRSADKEISEEGRQLMRIHLNKEYALLARLQQYAIQPNSKSAASR